ncbi:MAG: adenylate kinase [Negativicutes bacterium]|nr:adenylate kinase [Negativicutes bacterium]
MFIVLLGSSGVGKGTQAEKISNQLHIPHISTGEMFRQAIRTGRGIGREVRPYIKEGKLVPDPVVTRMLFKRILEKDCLSGCILDGYPRTVRQANSLDLIMQGLDWQLGIVLHIVVPDEEIIARTSGRRECSTCHAIYHLVSKPPRDPGHCDICGGGLFQRLDDREEVVRKRMEVYWEQTQPLVDYYHIKNLYCKINGSQPIWDVFVEIMNAIDRRKMQEIPQ